MLIAQSKLTSQGQISVPTEVRRKLGLGPGSIIEWEDDGENGVVVRRAARFSSEDVHQEIFEKRPVQRDLSALKEGIRQRMRKRHAKR